MLIVPCVVVVKRNLISAMILQRCQYPIHHKNRRHKQVTLQNRNRQHHWQHICQHVFEWSRIQGANSNRRRPSMMKLVDFLIKSRPVQDSMQMIEAKFTNQDTTDQVKCNGFEWWHGVDAFVGAPALDYDHWEEGDAEEGCYYQHVD